MQLMRTNQYMLDSMGLSFISLPFMVLVFSFGKSQQLVVAAF